MSFRDSGVVDFFLFRSSNRASNLSRISCSSIWRSGAGDPPPSWRAWCAPRATASPSSASPSASGSPHAPPSSSLRFPPLLRQIHFMSLRTNARALARQRERERKGGREKCQEHRHTHTPESRAAALAVGSRTPISPIGPPDPATRARP